ncbi:hypothetical protein LCGC14_1621770 [marine sediment metagenome]|uniref:Uncharacterized protein n=1 Tax=marine sediment metagenome TaxID=412755 RepID=A0A0F9I5A1_9ZZZZ
MKLKKTDREKGQKASEYLIRMPSRFILRSDIDFRYSITISNIDGSFFYLPSCYIEEDDEYIFVVEEHHGRICFEKELINCWDVKENDYE